MHVGALVSASVISEIIPATSLLTFCEEEQVRKMKEIQYQVTYCDYKVGELRLLTFDKGLKQENHFLL